MLRFQSLVWWIRGFKLKSHNIDDILAKFQSLVWWIRGFKRFSFESDKSRYLFQSLVWWIRGFKSVSSLYTLTLIECFNPWFGG